ncbi:hypothetical protein BGW80DRAFT_1254296 [Lactifluus volemus]|nr:hypothetical protein BGW80DRAFT_1254296 [Lactifluus volemus]
MTKLGDCNQLNGDQETPRSQYDFAQARPTAHVTTRVENLHYTSIYIDPETGRGPRQTVDMHGQWVYRINANARHYHPPYEGEKVYLATEREEQQQPSSPSLSERNRTPTVPPTVPPRTAYIVSWNKLI